MFHIILECSFKLCHVILKNLIDMVIGILIQLLLDLWAIFDLLE